MQREVRKSNENGALWERGRVEVLIGVGKAKTWTDWDAADSDSKLVFFFFVRLEVRWTRGFRSRVDIGVHTPYPVRDLQIDYNTPGPKLGDENATVDFCSLNQSDPSF